MTTTYRSDRRWSGGKVYMKLADYYSKKDTMILTLGKGSSFLTVVQNIDETEIVLAEPSESEEEAKKVHEARRAEVVAGKLGYFPTVTDKGQ